MTAATTTHRRETAGDHIDPITLEVIRHRLDKIAEEMLDLQKSQRRQCDEHGIGHGTTPIGFGGACRRRQNGASGHRFSAA